MSPDLQAFQRPASSPHFNVVASTSSCNLLWLLKEQWGCMGNRIHVQKRAELCRMQRGTNDGSTTDSTHPAAPRVKRGVSGRQGTGVRVSAVSPSGVRVSTSRGSTVNVQPGFGLDGFVDHLLLWQLGCPHLCWIHYTLQSQQTPTHHVGEVVDISELFVGARQ